ncbi:MAG: cell division protein FtsW [Chloroflexi bacterium]|nr:cell division protein FtsW [Chloroflexota bacterium]
MTRTRVEPPEFDYPLLILIAILVAFGLVMVFSASYSIAYYYKDDALYFFVRQLIWTGLGAVALLMLLNIDYRTWRDWAIPIIGVTLLALLAVLIMGSERFGARRQILGGSIQPSEIAKITIIMYVAAWLSSKGNRLRHVSYGLAPFAVLLGLLVSLIIVQPDISTSLVITVTAVAMFFIAGADLLQLGIIGLLGGTTFTLVISASAYAQERIQVFLDSFSNPLNAQNQQVRAAIAALMNGGPLGQGLGNGEYKGPFGVPMAHSDTIFAVVGEELGLLGALTVLALFFFFAYRGIRIARRAPDQFGALLAFGITTWLVVQALINIAVVTATFPVTGLPLPFFSYGGSSTLANLAAVGILLNISKGGGGLNLHAYSPFRRRNRRARVPDPERGRGAARRRTSYARRVRRF